MSAFATAQANHENAMRRFRLFVKSFIGVSGGGDPVPPTGGALTIDGIPLTIDGIPFTIN
jgi:hypothetical protein